MSSEVKRWKSEVKIFMESLEQFRRNDLIKGKDKILFIQNLNYK